MEDRSASRVPGRATPARQPPSPSGGTPLPERVRLAMERAFGVDFAAVRIHEGPQAAAAGAAAYTQGTDIFFAPGRYRPDSPTGRELLAHELSHVVQQADGRVSATRDVGGLAVNDDAHLEREADDHGAQHGGTEHGGTEHGGTEHGARDPDHAPAIGKPALRAAARSLGRPGEVVAQGKFLNLGTAQVPVYVGTPDRYDARGEPEPIVALLRTAGLPDLDEAWRRIFQLDGLQLHWLLAAMELARGTSPPTELLADYVKLRDVCIHEARLAQPDEPGDIFERQVLAVTGFFQRSLASGMGVAPEPSADRLKMLANTYNPRPREVQASGAVGAPIPFQPDRFRERMNHAIDAYIATETLRSTSAPQTNNVDQVRLLADHVQELAQVHFAPFVGKTSASAELLGVMYHNNVFDLETSPISEELARGYLFNRCAAVGAGEIWPQTGFDDSLHHGELVAIVDRLIRERGAAVVEILRATPRNDNGQVWMPRRVLDGQSLHRLRWTNLYTLCHEYLHTLQHPALKARAGSIARGQIVLEGFVEAFAYELKLLVCNLARRNPEFKALIEAGIPEGEIGAPPAPQFEYPAAAVPAFDIIHTLGVVPARKAYFMGAVELLGLRDGQLPATDTAVDEGGRPVEITPMHTRFGADTDAQERNLNAEAPKERTFLTPTDNNYVTDNANAVATAQVLRGDLKRRCAHLIARKAHSHPDDLPRPDHDDYRDAIAARAEGRDFLQRLAAMRATTRGLPESPLRESLKAMLEELEAWAIANDGAWVARYPYGPPAPAVLPGAV